MKKPQTKPSLAGGLLAALEEDVERAEREAQAERQRLFFEGRALSRGQHVLGFGGSAQPQEPVKP